MDDITFEQLETQQQRAAYCATVTLSRTELAPLLHLAMRASNANNETITRLLRAVTDDQVKIDGDDIRMIVELALQAKRAGPRKKLSLRVVPSPKKD